MTTISADVAANNNELLLNEKQQQDGSIVMTSTTPTTNRPRASMAPEEDTASMSIVVEDPSDDEHLVVVPDDQETTAGPSSVIELVVTPPPPPPPSSSLSDPLQVSHVAMDSSSNSETVKEETALANNDSSSPSPTKATAVTPDTTLVKSSSEKVFHSEYLQLKQQQQQQTASPKSPRPPAPKASASLSRVAAADGSPKSSPTKFELLRGMYDASPRRSPPATMKKMAATHYSPFSSPNTTKQSPSRRQKSPTTSGSKVNSNTDINISSNSHIVSAPPLAASDEAASTALADDDGTSNNIAHAQVFLEEEIARIKAKLERKRLIEEARIATAAHAHAEAAVNNRAPSWTTSSSYYGDAPTVIATTMTTLESQFDSILNHNDNGDKATRTAGLLEATTNTTPTATKTPATNNAAAAAAAATTATTRERHLDSIINDDNTPTSGVAAAAATTTAATTTKTPALPAPATLSAAPTSVVDVPYSSKIINIPSARMIVDLDDSVSMTSSRSLLSTPGTERCRLTTLHAAAVFSAPPSPLHNEEKPLDPPPAQEATSSSSSSSLDKLLAAAAKMQPQHPTTGGGGSPRNNRTPNSRQGSASNKRKHGGSNRSLRSGSSSNRSIKSIPGELVGDNNSTPSPATEGIALSSTTKSAAVPQSSSTSSSNNNNNNRRPSAGNSPMSPSGRKLKQTGEKATSPVASSFLAASKEGDHPRAGNELETRKMELSKRMEDLKETKRKLEINSSKSTLRRHHANVPQEQTADPTVLVSMPGDHRSRRVVEVGGVDKTVEEGQISIKRNYSRDGSEIPDDDFVAIPDDVYNMFFLSNVGGQAFYYVLYVFLLKMVLYTFLGTDVVQYPMPENVETKVKVTQFLMLPVAVTMQDDLITTIFLVSNVKYWPGVKEHNPDASRWKWKLANLFRGIDGLFSLFINFVVLLKAEQVLGLFLNFAALQFLQNIDNMALRLASDGYLTERLQTVAQNVKDCRLPRLHDEFLRTTDSLLFFFTFAILLVAWSVITFV